MASAATVSRSRERLKKLPWVPPETLIGASYIGDEGVDSKPRNFSPAPLMFLPSFRSLAPTNGVRLKGCYALGGL